MQSSSKNSTPKRTKSNQYHFCIRITPKTLSKSIFQSKGIQALYKIQMFKGSKKEASNVLKRNLHQQALQGFYRSQNCYFTLPYQMQIKFSQITQKEFQEHTIFVYKFSTFNLVKNFNQNGVRRTTHTVSKDFQTQFYIDFYIQSNKDRLQQKVRSDSNKQILKKRHLKQLPNYQQQQRDSERLRSQNYSPSRSSHRASSLAQYRLTGNSNHIKRLDFNTRSSTPLPKYGSNTTRRTSNEYNTQNSKSQKNYNNKEGHKYQYRSSQTINSLSESNTKIFYKRFPSSRQAYIDKIRQDAKEDQKTNKNIQGYNSGLANSKKEKIGCNNLNERFTAIDKVKLHIKQSPFSSLIIVSLIVFIFYLIFMINASGQEPNSLSIPKQHYTHHQDQQKTPVHPKNNKKQYKYSVKQKQIIFIYKDSNNGKSDDKQSIIEKTKNVKNEVNKIKEGILDNAQSTTNKKNKKQKRRRVNKKITWF